MAAEDILNSPTVRDGWTAVHEAGVRKKAGRVIYELASTMVNPVLRMSIGTAGMAMTFFVRFYSRKSMVKNHPFVMAVASLFLAGKANDEPRSLNRLMTQMLKQWYGRDNPELGELRANPDRMYELRNTVVDAEEILLITLEFDLNVDILTYALAQFVRDAQKSNVQALAPLSMDVSQAQCKKMCSNIMKWESLLVLQYDARTIALGICHYFLKHGKDIQVPEPGKDGKEWYEEYGLSVDACSDICSKISSANKQAKKAMSKTAKMNREGSAQGIPSVSQKQQYSPMYQSREGSPSKKIRLGQMSELDATQSCFTQASQYEHPPSSSQGPGNAGDDDTESLEEGEIR